MGEGLVFQREELERVIENVRSPQRKRVSKDYKYKKSSVIVIAGPTCCGKTELAILLAKNLGGEVVSADAMQFYRGMDIGTAKASIDQQLEVPHHLLDIKDINDPMNVSDFFVGFIKNK